MDSVLSVLAMVGCLLLLGWIMGSANEQGAHEQPQDEALPDRSHAQAGPLNKGRSGGGGEH